jgi:hypothetical protein
VCRSARALPIAHNPGCRAARRMFPTPRANPACKSRVKSNRSRTMSTPLSDHYKGYEIKVQAMRRAKERDEPGDGPRHFDIFVTIARSAAGPHARSEMFGVPDAPPFDSPIDATRAGIDYARDIIDNKVEGQSVEGL